MASFCKVGSRFINLDLVTDVREDRKKEGRIVIAFAAPQPASVASSDWSVESREIMLDGPEAKAVWSWLNRTSTDMIMMAPDF